VKGLFSTVTVSALKSRVKHIFGDINHRMLDRGTEHTTLLRRIKTIYSVLKNLAVAYR
jgi:hypothetical protein